MSERYERKPISTERLRELVPKTASPSIRFYDEQRKAWLSPEQWMAAQPISAFISDPNYLRKRKVEAEKIAAREKAEADARAARPKARKKSIAEEEVMLGDNAFSAAFKPLSKAEAKRRARASQKAKELRAAGQVRLVA